MANILNYDNIKNVGSIADFIEKSKLNNDAYLGLDNISNEAQKRMNQESVDSLSGDLYDIIQQNASLGLETSIIADKSKNLVQVIAHEPGTEVDLNGNLKELKKQKKIAIQNINLADRGGTRGGGKQLDYYYAINDKDRINMYRGASAQRKLTLKHAEWNRAAITAAKGEEKIRAVQGAWNSANRKMSNVANRADKEGQKELNKDLIVSASAETNMIKSNKIVDSGLISELEWAYKVQGRYISEALNIIKTIGDREQAIDAINNNKKLKVALSRGRNREELINKLTSFAKEYQLTDTTYRYSGESTEGHSLGHYNTARAIANDYASQTSRNQYYNNTPRRDVVDENKKHVYARSAIHSTKNVEAAGLKRGEGAKDGDVAFDAIARGVGLLPGQANDDVVYATSAGQKALDTRRDVKKTISKRRIDEWRKKLAEAGEVETADKLNAFLDKEFFSGINSSRPKSSFGKRNYELDEETGAYVVTAVEKMAAKQGTKVLGELVKGSLFKADEDSVVGQIMKDNNANFATVLPELGSANKVARKGTPLFAQFFEGLVQQYGSELGDMQGIGLGGLVKLLTGIESDSAENELTKGVAKIYREALNYDDKEGIVRPDFGKLNDEMLKQFKGENLGKAMLELLSVIDRLTNGVDKTTGALESFEDFYDDSNAKNRYFDYSRSNKTLGYQKDGKSIAIFGAYHQADEYPWGETDMSRMARSAYIDNALSGNKIDRNELEMFVSRYQPDANKITELKKLQNEYDAALKETADAVGQNYDEKYGKDSNVITIGYGEGNTIDISKDIQRSEIGDDGVVENISETLLGKVSAKIKEIEEAGGSAKVILRPNAGVFKVGSDGAMENVVIPNWAFDENRHSAGYSQLERSLFNYKNSTDVSDLTGDMESIELALHKDVFEEGGSTYENLTEKKAEGSWGAKTLPFDLEDIRDYANGGGNLSSGKKYAMTSGALVSPERLRELLKKNLSKSQLKNLAFLLTGKKNSGRKGLVESIMPYLTYGTKEFENTDFTNKELQNSLAGILMGRAPYSGLQNSYYLSAFADPTLAGSDATKLSLGATFGSGDDWDGDVASLVGVDKEDRDTFNALKASQEDMMRVLSLIKSKSIATAADAADGKLGAKEAAVALQPWIANKAAAEQRLQKTNTGALANLRRNWADRLEIDAKEGRDISFDDLLVHTMFEGIAQDAISSKKVINKIMQLGGYTGKSYKIDKDMTKKQAEAYSSGWNAINDIVAQAYSKDGAAGMFKLLKEIGLTDDSGLFAPEKKEIWGKTLASISRTKAGRQYLKDMGVVKSVDDANFSDADWLAENWDEDIVKNAFKGINEVALAKAADNSARQRGLEDGGQLFGEITKKVSKEKYHPDSLDNIYKGKSFEETATAINGASVAMDGYISRLDKLISLLEKRDYLMNKANKKDLDLAVSLDPRYSYKPDGGIGYMSISTALDRAFPFMGAPREPGKNTVAPNALGTFGHAYMEAKGNTDSRIYKKAKEEYLSKLEEAGIAADEQSKMVEEAKARFEKTRDFTNSLKLKNVGREVSLTHKSGLHGRLDNIDVDKDGNLVVTDYKFTDNNMSNRYATEVQLQMELLRDMRNKMIATWGKDQESVNWSERGSSKNVHAGAQSTYEKIIGNAVKDLVRGGMDEKGAGKLARAIFDANGIEGYLVQSKSSGKVARYKVAPNANPILLDKLMTSQGPLTKEEQASIGKMDFDRANNVVETESAEQQAARKQKENNKLRQEYVKLLEKQYELEKELAHLKQQESTEDIEKMKEYLEADIADNLGKTQSEKYKGIADKDRLDLENKLKIAGLNGVQKPEKPVEDKSLGARIGKDVAGGLQYTLGMFFRGGVTAKLIQGLIKDIKKVIELTKQLDQEIANIRVITGKTNEQAKEVMRTYNGLAKELGTTTAAVAKSGSEWLRQGYSVKESQELIRSSTYLARLGFMDEAKAVESLTAAMKGFNISATDSLSIVDKLTTLDAKYATTAGDIATALSNVAAVAKDAGMNLDETAAAITTIIDTTQQDASSVGNALKTMISRYGNVKAGAFTSDEDDDTANSINDIEKVLSVLGITIRSSATDMRDFSDVLDDVAEKWRTLTDVERNAIATAMAGTRQRNAFTALMSNYGTYKEALDAEKSSENTATFKNEAKKQTIEFQKEQITAAWEGFVQKLESSELVKNLYRSIALIINNIDKILPALVTTTQAILGFAPQFSSKIKSAFTPLLSKIDGLKGAIDNNTIAHGGEVAKAPGAGGISGKLNKAVGKHGATVGSMALAGVTTGIAYGLSGGGLVGNLIDDASGVTKHENMATNIGTGIITGGLTAGLSALLGPVAGQIIGPIVGDLVSSGLKSLIFAEQIAIDKRVENAEKEVEILDKLEKSVNDAQKAVKSSSSDWTSEDWLAVKTAAADMAASLDHMFGEGDERTSLRSAFEKTLETIGLFDEGAANASDAIKTLADGASESAKVLEAFKATELLLESQAQFRTHEAEIADLEKQKRKAKDSTMQAGFQAQIDKFYEDRADSALEAAYMLSGFSTKNAAELYGESQNSIINTVAKELESVFAEYKITDSSENQMSVYDSNGNLKDSVVSDVLKKLVGEDNMSGVMKGSSVTLSKLMEARGKYTGYNYDTLVRQAMSKDGGAELDSWLKQMGGDSNEWIKYLLGNDTSKIDTFANSLRMTEEQLSAIGDDLWFYTQQDAVSSLDAYINKMKDLSGVMSDIAKNGKLSSEGLNKITKQFPEIAAKVAGNFTAQSVIESISEMFFGEAGKQAIAAQVYTDVLKDSVLWGSTKENESTLKTIFGEDVYKENAGKIQSSSSIQDILGLFIENEKASNWLNSIIAMNAQTVADTYSEYYDTILEAQNRVYDNEIDNLNSIKDSLEYTNKQRETELNLIKAKQNLENAQNEKKRVYRAGIGFTYETDQQAVKDAQEKLDQLERERSRQDVQYQIDLLTQQKDILSEIREELSAESQAKIMSDVVSQIGSEASIKKVLQSINDMSEQVTKLAEKTYGGEAEFGSAEIAKNKERLDNAIATFETMTGSSDRKWTKDELETAKADVSSAYSAYKKTADTYGIKNEYEDVNKRVQSYDIDKAIEFSLKDYIANEGNYKGEDKTEATIGSTHYESVNSYIKFSLDGSGHLILDDNGSLVLTRSKRKETELGGGERNWVEYNFNGKYGELSKLANKITKEYGDTALDPYNVTGTQTPYTVNPLTTSNGANRAVGDRSFHGGNVTINEEGLEGIVTPEGTITSLPARSGIIPADLTKNLWMLGEVAPNLVKCLADMTKPYALNNHSASNDNSMHVGTLNATFNTTEGFDSEEFWTDVRNQIAITKNNH